MHHIFELNLEGPGPIQTRLLGVPHGIQGLAIGAFGETGKGISDYFHLLATIATKRVDRAVGGGCRMARRWGHLRSDEGPPPEALLTSRRARSGEGSAPRAPGDHGKEVEEAIVPRMLTEQRARTASTLPEEPA